MSAELPATPAGEPVSSREPRVFISFDPGSDLDLYERLCGESASAGSGFVVLGGSEVPGPSDAGEQMRRSIREADQMIVICTENTGRSSSVARELDAAREAGTPYMLLWGRRQSMCTKPTSAKPTDVIYLWSRDVLRDQIERAAQRGRSER